MTCRTRIYASVCRYAKDVVNTTDLTSRKNTHLLLVAKLRYPIRRVKMRRINCKSMNENWMLCYALLIAPLDSFSFTDTMIL